MAYRRGVAAGTERIKRAGSQQGPVGWSRVASVLWRLTKETTAICFRYRVTGLAAEAGFFALLSLPPLVLGLVGSINYVATWIGQDVVDEVQDRILDGSRDIFTSEVVTDVIAKTLDDVIAGDRFDLVSIGFLIALWSGSRALNVFIDTCSIMYGLGGMRGIIRTRALSFSLYVVVLLVGIVVIPLVLAGPTLLGRVLPDQVEFLNSLYWPVATLLSVLSLTSLYHVSVPVRTPWRRDLPGALLAIAIWFLGSYVRALDHRQERRRRLDLRPARDADRAAHLDVRHLDRGADRGGAQRGRRDGVAAPGRRRGPASATAGHPRGQAEPRHGHRRGRAAAEQVTGKYSVGRAPRPGLTSDRPVRTHPEEEPPWLSTLSPAQSSPVPADHLTASSAGHLPPS